MNNRYRYGRTNFELVLLFGWSLWLSIAAFNNIIDSNTNIFHLQNMLGMNLLKSEEILGQGLLWKQLPESIAPYLLYFIIAIQISVCILLWRTVLFYFLFIFGIENNILKIKKVANFSITAFLFLWIFFLCGGLWLGYWIKQGPIQSVHMTLVIIAITTFIVINLPEKE